MLLYRKENSELDSYCCYNVYLSYLYISRQNETNISVHPTFHHVQEF
jgi:hypothetical protein